MTKSFKTIFLRVFVLVEILLLIAVFLAYLASSPKTLQSTVDLVIKDNNISYSDIQGSLLDSITVYKPKYKDLTIADYASISWDINTIFSTSKSIKSIELTNVDPYSIEQIIKDMSKDKNTTTNTHKKIDIDLVLNSLRLSLKPYKNGSFNLRSSKLELEKFAYANGEITLAKFHVNASSNLSNVDSKGGFNNGVLRLDELNIKKLNIENIQKLIKELKTAKNNKNSKIPIKEIIIKKATIDTSAFVIAKNKIEKIEIDINNLDAKIDNNISKTLINVKDIHLNAKADLGMLDLDGKINSNVLYANSKVNLDSKYFSSKTKIIDFASLNPIRLQTRADLKGLDNNLSLKSNGIFKGKFKKYNVSINRFFSKIHYDFQSKILSAKSDANITSPYSNEIIGDNTLLLDKNLSLKYQGHLYSKKLRKFPKKFLPLFDNAKAFYQGDKEELLADLNTSAFNLKYAMQNFKKAKFKLHSKELNVSKYFDLPKELKDLKAVVDAKMKLNFKKPKVFIDTNITSNALNTQGVIDFKQGFRYIAKTKLAKNSILKNIDKNIKLNSIFPSDLNLSIKKHILHTTLANSVLKHKLSYDLNSSKIDLMLDILGDEFKLSGDKKEMNFNTKILSLKELQSKLSKVYDFKPIPLDGEVDINSSIFDFKDIKLALDSRWLVYEYTKNKFAFAEKIHINLEKHGDKITIPKYDLHAFIADDDRYLFSNQESVIYMKEDRFEIENLWINDSLKNSGFYDLKGKHGIINSRSGHFIYKGKEGKFTLAINLKSTLGKNSTSVKGKITALKALITYKYKNSYEIDDPDIIILQEKEKDEQKSSSTLIVDIVLDSKAPLRYKNENIDIYFKPDLKLWKEREKNLELLGRIEIIKGRYIQQTKEFKILPSELLFGGDMKNPYLSIKAKYYSNPYEITIDISGKLDSPIINFSSNPYLSQSDILSLLLFDSTSDSLLSHKGNGSNIAISFFGSTFAKEIVSKFGIKLDKLVVTTNEEGGLGVEIGKKISKRVTIIYINDIVQTIKVKYQHSNHFETDLTISPESSGVDFIYKKEY